MKGNGDMMVYELFCHSVQGAGHLKYGIPRQDYGLKLQNEDCKIFVLGDGHGDSNCPRSDIGSKTLCEIAQNELAVFARELRQAHMEHKLFDKYAVEPIVRQLIISIFGKWSCSVNDHFLANPFTEQEEQQAASMMSVYKRGERIEHIYGTTFIGGLMTDKYFLLLQQGDGRCVVFDSDGNASQPIPWDDRCFANVTTSVCEADAVSSCRYYVIDLEENPIIACVLGSDGVEDSFNNMELMHCYYREELLFAAENGVEAYEERMAETLPELSANGIPGLSAFGSQDDVTICGVIDRAAVRGKSEKFGEDGKKAAINSAISRVDERIRSMEAGKMDYLKNKCRDADAECERIKQKYFALKKDYDDIDTDLKEHLDSLSRKIPGLTFLSEASINLLKRDLAKIRDEMDEIRKSYQTAEVNRQAAIDEYKAYMQRYEELLKTRKEYEDMLASVDGVSVNDPTPEAEAQPSDDNQGSDGNNVDIEATYVPEESSDEEPIFDISASPMIPFPDEEPDMPESEKAEDPGKIEDDIPDIEIIGGDEDCPIINDNISDLSVVPTISDEAVADMVNREGSAGDDGEKPQSPSAANGDGTADEPKDNSSAFSVFVKE